jgi:hypothetical protein
MPSCLICVCQELSFTFSGTQVHNGSQPWPILMQGCGL